MSSKLLVNWHEGRLEVEGSEELIREIYTDFKQLTALKKRLPGEGSSTIADREEGAKIDDSTADKKKNGSARTQKTKLTKPTVISDLNLWPSDKQSLKDFMGQYAKHNAGEHSLLIIYYLKEMLQIETVTANHVYTCMHELDDKLPTDTRKFLNTHMIRYKWIEPSGSDNYVITVRGLNQIRLGMKKTDTSIDQAK
jgi:hypothetical protein